MKEENIDRYISIWAELVDWGEILALGMVKNTQPESDATTVLKEALEEQSRIHHQANIEIFRKLNKLNKYDKSGNYKSA